MSDHKNIAQQTFQSVSGTKVRVRESEVNIPDCLHVMGFKYDFIWRKDLMVKEKKTPIIET